MSNKFRDIATCASWFWFSEAPLLSMPTKIVVVKVWVLHIQKLPFLPTFKEMGKTKFIRTWKRINLPLELYQPVVQWRQSFLIWGIFHSKCICILQLGVEFLFRTYWLFFPISVQKSVLSAAKEIDKMNSSDSSRKFMSC